MRIRDNVTKANRKRQLSVNDVFRFRNTGASTWSYRKIVQYGGETKVMTLETMKPLIKQFYDLTEINDFYFKDHEYEVELITDFELVINSTEVLA